MMMSDESWGAWAEEELRAGPRVKGHSAKTTPLSKSPMTMPRWWREAGAFVRPDAGFCRIPDPGAEGSDRSRGEVCGVASDRVHRHALLNEEAANGRNLFFQQEDVQRLCVDKALKSIYLRIRKNAAGQHPWSATPISIRTAHTE